MLEVSHLIVSLLFTQTDFRIIKFLHLYNESQIYTPGITSFLCILYPFLIK